MKFEIIVAGKLRHTIEANSMEMAYLGFGTWYNPETPVTIRNPQTNEQCTYTRNLDNAGNLLEIIQH